MDTIKCPSCGVNKMKEKIISEFHTKLGGVPFVASNAKILECEQCGERIFDAKEIKRWEKELQKQLQTNALLVTPKDVKEIRERLNLNVTDFARLFGVTRQTVYAWEDEKNAGIQLGPAALLIRLLIEECEGQMKGVYNILLELANKRGQTIKSKMLYSEETSDDVELDNNVDNSDTLLRQIPELCPSFAVACSN
ncbi:MAG: type II TA system antitoxin MqsA family protein [Planctomycetota bacterium]